MTPGGGVVVVVFFFWRGWDCGVFLLECLSTLGFCLFFSQARSKFDIHSDGY